MGRGKGKIAGIVLAAGASTRMGRAKQLLPLGDETLIGRVLEEVLKAELDSVILVLGHSAQEIQAVVAPVFSRSRLRIIENIQYRQGIGTSIVAGISAVEHTHDHAMIFLADMPCIPRKLINRLCRRYLASGMRIGAVRGSGRPGHPVIFNRDLYPELKQLKGDVGARSLLQKYKESVCLIEPDAGYDTLDIDTPEDYAGFQSTLKLKVSKAGFPDAETP